MTGVRYIGSLSSAQPTIRNFEGGGVFAAGDFVMVEGATGQIVVATAGSPILGIAMEAGTDGKAKVAVNVTPDMLVLMSQDNVAATADAAYRLQYQDMVGATGVMYADTSDIKTTTAQLLCLEFNPKGYGADADTTVCKFLVAERTVGIK